MDKATNQYHVLKIPLRVSPREAMIIQQRFRVLGKLKNAMLNELFRRVNQYKRDPRYRALAQVKDPKAKSKGYQQLREEYGLTQNDARELSANIFRESKWMPLVIQSHVRLPLADEVWTSVEQWLFNKKGKPRFQPATDLNTAWGTSKSGMQWLGEEKQVQWNNGKQQKSPHWEQMSAKEQQQDVCRRHRKKLQLNIDCSDGWLKKHLGDRNVQRVGITQEMVRGKTRYFALLCVQGQPYRNPEYLDSVNQGGVVGLDPGPSGIAVVSDGASFLYTRAPHELLQQRKQEQAEKRRRQRALDRSRRAMNPDCYDVKGRSTKGKRPKQKSKRMQRIEAKLAAQSRTEQENRRREEDRFAHILMQQGNIVGVETTDFTSWQKSLFGKRMQFTAPGSLYQRIKAETQRVGGQFIQLDTWNLALSQHCLCGNRAKKPLSQRSHKCPHCGLGIKTPLVQRDMFSGLLAQLVTKHIVQQQEKAAAQAKRKPKNKTSSSNEVTSLSSKSLDLSQGPFDTLEHRQTAGNMGSMIMTAETISGLITRVVTCKQESHEVLVGGLATESIEALRFDTSEPVEAQLPTVTVSSLVLFQTPAQDDLLSCHGEHSLQDSMSRSTSRNAKHVPLEPPPQVEQKG